MKRTLALTSTLVLLLSLTLVSCDEMFSNNIFAGVTQKKLSASSVNAMTPSEVVDLTSSKQSMAQLSDPATKAAALATLEPAYDTPAEQASVPGQAAAIAAAEISIGTVPAAAQFSSAAASLLANPGALDPTASTATIVDAVSNLFPTSIVSQLSTSPTPPPEFTAMIEAYTEAYPAYEALSAGVTASGGSYADPTITSAQKLEIAANAVIASLVISVTPTSGASTTASVAAGLWSALQDPTNASSYISMASTDLVTGAGSTVSGLLPAGFSL